MLTLWRWGVLVVIIRLMEVWFLYGHKPEDVSSVAVAHSGVVAKALVKELLEQERHGETLQIETTGEIHNIEPKEYDED